MRSLRNLLVIFWTSKIQNTVVLSKCGLPTMFMLRQRRLRWMGHVRRMKNGRIFKDILYRKLIADKRALGRLQLRYRDVCQQDIYELNIDLNKLEELDIDQVEKLFAKRLKYV